MDKYINTKIKEELHNSLKEKARSMNISIASVVRIAISEYLRKEER